MEDWVGRLECGKVGKLEGGKVEITSSFDIQHSIFDKMTNHEN